MSPAFAAEHARLVRDGRFQFDFSVYTAPQTPRWAEQLARWLKPLAPFVPYIFWGVVAAFVFTLAFLIAREVIRQRRQGSGVGAKLLEGGLAPSSARVRALLAEADRMAAEGRFGEAVRVLLFRTLDDLEDRRPGLVGPAQTAREIAALEAIPAPAREPLSRIAAAVERFLFAGRPLDAEAFAEARAAYGRFVEAASAA
jgi:hypothetical protein